MSSNLFLSLFFIHTPIKGEVRAQDSVFIIVAVAVNPKGRDMAWQFFKDNHQKLLEQYQVKDNRNIDALTQYLFELISRGAFC